MPPQAAFERVLTITEYYDGPGRGVAHFHGRSHLYESQYVDIDSDAEDEFLLTPLSPDVVEAAVEDWAIWLRWQEAFHRGHGQQDTHPALPVDRARHEELAARLARKLKGDPASGIRAHGEFRVREDSSKQFGWRELEVRWTPCASGG